MSAPVSTTEAIAGVQQSYRKAVTNTRRDKQKAGRPAGLTEEQKLEIRYTCCLELAPAGVQVFSDPPRTSHGWSKAMSICAKVCCCREAFDLFDTDGSGTIDAKELKVAMRCALTEVHMIPEVLRTCAAVYHSSYVVFAWQSKAWQSEAYKDVWRGTVLGPYGLCWTATLPWSPAS